jgi:hypothetical protein
MAREEKRIQMEVKNRKRDCEVYMGRQALFSGSRESLESDKGRFHRCAETTTDERASNAQRCNIPSAHIQLPLSPQIVKIARPLAGEIVKRIFFVCYSGAAEKAVSLIVERLI